MSEEEPLHVKVAEALGWHHIDDILGPGILWRGVPPGIEFVEDEEGNYPFLPIPAYDTDWGVTGPLIEKYQMALRPLHRRLPERCGGNLWEAYYWDYSSEEITKGSTGGPLPAVCHLILTLHRAGKLPQSRSSNEED